MRLEDLGLFAVSVAFEQGYLAASLFERGLEALPVRLDLILRDRVTGNEYRFFVGKAKHRAARHAPGSRQSFKLSHASTIPEKNGLAYSRKSAYHTGYG